MFNRYLSQSTSETTMDFFGQFAGVAGGDFVRMSSPA